MKVVFFNEGFYALLLYRRILDIIDVYEKYKNDFDTFKNEFYKRVHLLDNPVSDIKAFMIEINLSISEDVAKSINKYDFIRFIHRLIMLSLYMEKNNDYEVESAFDILETEYDYVMNNGKETLPFNQAFKDASTFVSGFKNKYEKQYEYFILRLVSSIMFDYYGDIIFNIENVYDIVKNSVKVLDEQGIFKRLYQEDIEKLFLNKKGDVNFEYTKRFFALVADTIKYGLNKEILREHIKFEKCRIKRTKNDKKSKSKNKDIVFVITAPTKNFDEFDCNISDDVIKTIKRGEKSNSQKLIDAFKQYRIFLKNFIEKQSAIKIDYNNYCIIKDEKSFIKEYFKDIIIGECRIKPYHNEHFNSIKTIDKSKLSYETFINIFGAGLIIEYVMDYFLRLKMNLHMLDISKRHIKPFIEILDIIERDVIDRIETFTLNKKSTQHKSKDTKDTKTKRNKRNIKNKKQRNNHKQNKSNRPKSLLDL